MPLINPELLKLARYSLREGWMPSGTLEKAAIVPPGGGDPTGGAGGPAGAAPGGAPPGGGPPPGMASPGAAPPGADPSGGVPGGPPPGPLDPAAMQQIVQAVTQAMGGAGGAGKGKSPKDQILAGQMKLLISLNAQMASKMGIQVDPQLLIPPTDPATDQMAMQETANASMMPSNDPNSSGAPGAPPGGAPSGGGGAPPPPGGPAPVQPMDAGQGPIGKAAAAPVMLGRVLGLDDQEESIGQEYSIPRLQQNRQKAAARLKLLQSLARDR